MKVLYILGRGRGGSTILGNVLGEVSGFFCAGESRTFWDPVVKRDGACGCGLPVSACPVWSRVLDELRDIAVEEAARRQHAVVQEKRLLKLLRHSDAAFRWDEVDRFKQIQRRFYTAVSEVTASDVIVDTSKRPSYAAALRGLPGVDLRIVHLIRDPRASAHSWQSRRYDSVAGGEVRRRNALDSTLRWDLLNLEAEILLRRVGPEQLLQMRYEDFATAPLDAVRRIMGFIEEEERDLPFQTPDKLSLGVNHTIAGNPSRFTTGELTIQDRAEWRENQAPRSRWASTIAALPLLKRYGYPLRP